MNVMPDSNGPLYLIIFHWNHKVHQGKEDQFDFFFPGNSMTLFILSRILLRKGWVG